MRILTVLTPLAPPPSVTRPTIPIRRGARRTVTFATLLLGFIAISSEAAEAQSSPDQRRGWEFVVPSGFLIPTGSQRDAIQRGGLTAVQLSYVVRPPLALAATVGWARSRDVVSAGRPKLDVFMVDLGGEWRGPRWFAEHRVTLRPLVGVGAGTRSYNYRSLDVDATHNAAVYAGGGGELGMGRVRLRLEARSYWAGFKPLDGVGASDVRNDVALMLGLRLVRR